MSSPRLCTQVAALSCFFMGCSSEAPSRDHQGATTGGQLGSGGAHLSGGSTASSGGTPTSGGRSATAMGGMSNAMGGMGNAMGGMGNSSTGGSTSASGGSGVTGCNGAELCDGFEGAAPGANGSDWTIEKQNVTALEVVSSKAHSGAKSLHISFPAMSANNNSVFGYIAETKTFPAANNTFWGRMWVWFATGQQGSHVVHVEARGAGATEGVRVTGTYLGDILTNMEVDDQSHISSTPITEGVWECYEWYAGGGNTVRVYIDGGEITGATATDFPLPTFGKLRLGFQRWEPDLAGELWIDDVAVAGSRIGCQ